MKYISTFTIIVICGVISLCSLEAQEAIPSAQHSNNQSNTANHDAQELISRLAEYDSSNPFVDSPEALPFHLEIFLYAPATKNLPLLNVSEVMEWNGLHSSNFGRSDKFGLRFIYTDLLHLRLTEAGQWQPFPNTKWGIVIDEKSNQLDSLSHAKSNGDYQICIKPSAFVYSRITNEDMRVVHHYFRQLRSIRLELNNDKGDLWLKFRTPSDQIRFQYPLESIWVFEEMASRKTGEKYELTFCINSFSVGNRSEFIFNHPERLRRYVDLLPSRSLNLDKPNNNTKYVYQFKNDSQFASSSAMYKIVNSNHADATISTKKQPENNNIATKIRDISSHLSRVKNTESDANEQLPAEHKEKFNEALIILKQLTLQSHIQENDATVSVADQFMRWKHLESRYGPTTISNFYDAIVKHFLLNKHLTSEMRVEIAEALADLGYPRHTGGGENVLKACHNNAFVDSLFRVRWEISTLTDKHVSTCLELDKFPSKPIVMNNIVVETLIRMNEVERINPVNLRIWFNTEIDQVDGPRRIMNLSTLTSQQSGRQYLLKRLTEGAENEGLRQDIIKHLEALIDATTKTERFDFISKSECEEIRNVIGKGI